MSTSPSTPAPSDVPALPAAPFDSRSAVRQPPPPPPSVWLWLDPLSEPPPTDDEPMVVVVDDASTDEPPVGDEHPPASPDPISSATGATPALSARRPGSPRRGKSLAKPEDNPRLQQFPPEQRPLIADSWRRNNKRPYERR
jgi:hypothetical protein